MFLSNHISTVWRMAPPELTILKVWEIFCQPEWILRWRLGNSLVWPFALYVEFCIAIECIFWETDVVRSMLSAKLGVLHVDKFSKKFLGTFSAKCCYRHREVLQNKLIKWKKSDKWCRTMSYQRIWRKTTEKYILYNRSAFQSHSERSFIYFHQNARIRENCLQNL